MGSPQASPSSAAVAETKLTFYSRYFCKPAPHLAQDPSASLTSSTSSSPSIPVYTHGLSLPPEKMSSLHSFTTPQHRKFSYLSRGSIIVATSLLMAFVTALVVALAVTLTHQAPTSGSSKTTYQSSSSSPAAANASAVTNPPPAANPYQYTHAPIRLGILSNFPDPSIYYHQSKKLWYAFATNPNAGILNAPPSSLSPTIPANIQFATSTDFRTWTLQSSAADPLHTLGEWVAHSSKTGNFIANVWSPEAIQHPDGNQFLLYYSAGGNKTVAPYGGHCVGAAVATMPEGPYTPQPTPLACHSDLGGAIDPVAFVEPSDNTIYVAYKIDGNNRHGSGGACGNSNNGKQSDTPIMLQRMLPDGLTPDPKFPATTILHRTAGDGPLVEAPSLVKVGPTYFLFFSSGCTRSPTYNVRYATSSSITGPYVRPAHSLLLKSTDYGLLAPGSVSVRFANNTAHAEDGSTSGSGWKMALHARVRINNAGVRAMFTVGLKFTVDGSKPGQGGVVLVDGSVSVT